MGLTERLTKSLENFIRFGDKKSMELSAEGLEGTTDDVTTFTNGTVNITREVAIKITALNEGVNLISDSIAALPVYLWEWVS